MTLALAKYLVQEGLVTPSEMDDVLQRQVIFGGSVDTNILELSKLNEQTLTEALSQVHNLPMATAALLEKKNPKVANLLPARLAEKYQVLPVTMAGRNIVVLACERIDPINEEKLGFILSLKIKTYLVCEARLQQYLSDWLNVYIEPRYKALLTRMGTFHVQPAPAQKEPPEAPGKTDELTPKETKPLSVDQDKVKQVLSDVEADEQNKHQKRQQARSGRILTDEAIKACFQANHRDIIVDTTLRYARQFLPFVGLFVIDDDHILGWDAVGSDNARSLIKKIRIPTRISTVLSMVVNTRAYYLGPMPKSQPNQALLRSLQRPHPPNVLVVPIILKKRLIGLLFGDSSEKAIKSNRLGELLLFVNVLPQAFEHLLLRKKAEVQSPVTPKQNQTAEGKTPSTAQPQKAFTKWVVSQRTQPSEQKQPRPKDQVAPAETETQAPTVAGPDLDEALPAISHQPDSLEQPPRLEVEITNQAPPEQPPPQMLPDHTTTAQSGPEPELEEASPADTEPKTTDETLDTTSEPRPEHRDAPRATQPMFERLNDETPAQESTATEKRDPDEFNISKELSEEQDDSAPRPKSDTDQTVPAFKSSQSEIDQPSLDSPATDEPLHEPKSTSDEESQETKDPAPEREENLLAEVHIDQLMSQADTALEARQIDQLVEQLVNSNPDLMSLAVKNLTEIGPRALDTIMKRFPGTLRFDIRNADGWIPPIAQHSELIRCVIEMGPNACLHVADKLDDRDPTIRYYALKIMGEVACPAYFDRLTKRLYDRDVLVRTTAIDVLQVYRGTPGYKKMLADLRGKLNSPEPNLQAMAAALLGNLKDTLSLPLLVDLLGSPSPMVVRAALESLRFVTKQNFHQNQKKWRKWLKNHKDQQRIQWLIAGLRSADPELRYSASQELQQVTSEAFNYYFDAGKRERNKAVRKWETWWKKFGRYQAFDEDPSSHPT